MGRRKNRKQIEVVPDYEWPFEVSIKLNRNRPKVAFLSGVPRDYYPDDPGYSKFGLTYCLPYPDDTAKPNYYPSSDRLQKPVSLLGYGIGGLSGPRFAPLLNEDNPAPNEYQSELVPPRVKKSEKVKRMKWKEFVEKYEAIVEEQAARYEKGLQEPKEGKAKQVPYHASHRSPNSTNWSTKTKQMCQKRFSAFGMSLNNSRFAKEISDEKVGVGTYETGGSTFKKSYQITNNEGKLIPRVRLVCHPSGCDVCMICNTELFFSDYYQTIKKYKVLNYKDVETEGTFKMRNLNLCRACYCEATKNGCPPWKKEKIPDVFVKARHCNSVHDHREGFPEFLTKSSCKSMMNLARKELIYSKYFKDTPCEKKI